jgi:hypothetical protein
MHVRFLVLLAFTAALCGQRQASTTFDFDGNRLPGPVWTTAKTAGGEQRIVTTSSLNGREIPVESVEDRVVTKSDTREVIERSIVRYDAGGNPMPPERVRIEQTKTAGDGQKVVTTTWQTDVNGVPQLVERRSEEKSASGSGTTMVERSGKSGALETFARIDRAEARGRTVVREFRMDLNGGFFEVQREVTLTTVKSGVTVADATRYEPLAGGEFEPATRTVTRSSERAGGKTQEIDVYSRYGGQVAGEPRLERQIRQEERMGAGGVVIRLTSARSDPAAGFQPVQETRIEPSRK